MKQTLLLTAAAAACVLLAAPARALDLMDAYARAATHDATIAAAGDALRAGREKAVQGRALLLPQVQLGASLSQVSERSSTADLPPPLADAAGGSGSARVHELALALKQPIVDAKAQADRRQLEQQTALAELRFADARQALMQRVAEAYFQLLLADEALRVAQAEKAAMALQRERAQARFDVGRGRVTELHEAEARYDTVATREVSAASTLALRQAQFEALTGAPATGLATLRGGFVPAAPEPASAEAWQSRAVAGNTRVLARQHELAIAGFEIDKYRLAARPTLDLVASVGRQGQSGGLPALAAPEGRRSAAVGLQFNLPLYTGGAIRSREREAIARRDQAGQELAEARRDARLQAHDAYLAVTTGVSRVGALEQQLRSAQTALDATTLARDVGTRTELDVLDAQQRLYTARLDLAQARHDYLLGRVRLAGAAGALHEDDLRALNAFLAP